MSKKTEKAHATALRKRGFSYREIARYVGVSVSTVSLWFKGESWSDAVTARNVERAARENSKRISLLNKARTNQFNKLYSEAERSAHTEYKHYKHDPLFVAGLTVYACTGDRRTPSVIHLSSGKLDSHRVFVAFLTEYLGVPREKIRFWVLLSLAHDPERISRAWSKNLKIPLSQFHKYQVMKGKGSQNVLQYGVGNTIIGNAVLKRKLTTWIELLLKELT